MPIIDILQKIEVVIKVLTIPLQCKGNSKDKTIAEQIQIYCQDFFEMTFGLNSFELENFEKQKKYTQVLFEDAIIFGL